MNIGMLKEGEHEDMCVLKKNVTGYERDIKVISFAFLF